LDTLALPPMTTQSVPTLAVQQNPDVDRAVEVLRAGGMVLLVEPGDPLPGGYLVAGAQTVTQEVIARMLATAHGTPFVALPASRCAALGLPEPGRSRRASRNFLVNIEAREGTTTGISAADRALTMRVAADPASTAADIIVPGHIVPVRVEEGGVLVRAGAPEAAVDLMLLGGGSGGAAMCQLLDDDGGAPTPRALEQFAHDNDLHFVRTVDVLDQRLGSEKLVERISDSEVETVAGRFRVVSYADELSSLPHYAIVQGRIDSALPVGLHVQVQNPLVDAVGVPSDAGVPISDVLTTTAQAERAVVLYLAPSVEPPATEDEDAATRFGGELLAATRRSHVVTQILRDLGVRTVDVGARVVDSGGS
jgi:3,4-dihydroxy 2-butanone 4-phosphate synthase/GTP cyclohydrolase II